jgi:hypothetical protein
MAQVRRSDLAASAEAVSYWMSQDVRGALPNSLRAGAVGGRPVVEMIDVAAVAIYRDAGTEGDTLDSLRPTTGSTFSACRRQSRRMSSSTTAARRAGMHINSRMSSRRPASTRGSSTVTLSNLRFASRPFRRTGGLSWYSSERGRFGTSAISRRAHFRRYDDQPMTAAMCVSASGNAVAADCA